MRVPASFLHVCPVFPALLSSGFRKSPLLLRKQGPKREECEVVDTLLLIIHFHLLTTHRKMHSLYRGAKEWIEGNEGGGGESELRGASSVASPCRCVKAYV